VASLNDERNLAPLTADLHATDTGRDFHLDRPDSTTAALRISGTEADILAWLMGRSDGATLTRASLTRASLTRGSLTRDGLTTDGLTTATLTTGAAGKLPAVPSIYYT
jgi:hypothetical protein